MIAGLEICIVFFFLLSKGVNVGEALQIFLVLTIVVREGLVADATLTWLRGLCTSGILVAMLGKFFFGRFNHARQVLDEVSD